MLSAMSSAASRKSQKKRKGRAEVVVTVVMGACASKSESPQPQPPTDGSDHCDACGENLNPHPLGVTPRFQPCRHALCTACLRNLATDDNFVHGVGFRCPALGRILPPFDECDAPRALCTTVISPGAFLPYLGGSPYPLPYLARETPEVAGYIRYHEALQSCSVCGEFRGLTTEAQEWYRPSDTSRCRHDLCGSCQRGIVSAFIERGPEAGPKLICPAIDGPDDTRCTVPILPQSLLQALGTDMYQSLRNTLDARSPSGTSSVQFIKKHCRRCPKCKVPVMRAGGCSHMYCSQCDIVWCWDCCKVYFDEDEYEHSRLDRFLNMRRCRCGYRDE